MKNPYRFRFQISQTLLISSLNPDFFLVRNSKGLKRTPGKMISNNEKMNTNVIKTRLKRSMRNLLKKNIRAAPPIRLNIITSHILSRITVVDALVAVMLWFFFRKQIFANSPSLPGVITLRKPDTRKQERIVRKRILISKARLMICQRIAFIT